MQLEKTNAKILKRMSRGRHLKARLGEPKKTFKKNEEWIDLVFTRFFYTLSWRITLATVPIVKREWLEAFEKDDIPLKLANDAATQYINAYDWAPTPAQFRAAIKKVQGEEMAAARRREDDAERKRLREFKPSLESKANVKKIVKQLRSL